MLDRGIVCISDKRAGRLSVACCHVMCTVMSFLCSVSSMAVCCLQGNINLIRAAAKAGVKRFVLVTSIGTGDSKDAPPKQVYDVLKRVLEEKTKAEEELKVTGLCGCAGPGLLYCREALHCPCAERLAALSCRPRTCNVACVGFGCLCKEPGIAAL